jgi:transcriptional regulator with PAS, ATPase and Fis domain
MDWRKPIINCLIEKDGNYCKICNLPFSNIAPPEIDHIISVNQGGIDSIKNYQLVHSICNRKKGGGKIINQFLNGLTSKLGYSLEKEIYDLKVLRIKEALEKTEGNITKAANLLNITRRELGYFIKTKVQE